MRLRKPPDHPHLPISTVAPNPTTALAETAKVLRADQRADSRPRGFHCYPQSCSHTNLRLAPPPRIALSTLKAMAV